MVEEDVAIDMPKQKIILRRRVTPQRVQFSNGQSFVARYKRVNRQNVPPNVTVRQTRQIGLQNNKKRKTQTGGSIFENNS